MHANVGFTRKCAIELICATLSTIVAIPASAAGVVFENSDIARQRMELLIDALWLYANLHSGQLPADLSELYPEYVSDPLVFWHPGDPDPPPTTIDNSVPNAPNSAQISFEWFDPLEGSVDSIVIQDNGPENNAGLFINMLTADGVFETDPPLATPTPTALQLAKAHLERLYESFLVFSNDHSGHFPDDLIELWQVYILTPRSFWNPGDEDPLPEDITNSKLNAPNSTQISFEYLVPGVHHDELSPDMIVIGDNTPANNAGAGIIVVKGDGSVVLVLSAPCAADFNGDGDVGIIDLLMLLAQWGPGPGQPADFLGDGTVDYDDLIILFDNWGACL